MTARALDPTPLVTVAHGSRDPRSARTMSAIADRIRSARPDLDVRLAFLDLNAPSVPAVLDTVACQGHRSAVVVPLLLGNAFHARVDLPALLAAARARHPRLRLTQADVLGPDPRLVDALRDRLSESGIDPADETVGVATAAVGSSSETANRSTAAVAELLAAGTNWHVAPCFATTAPSVTDAAALLRSRGARHIVVAPWFLAPGLLTDRLAAAGHPVLDTIGAHPRLVEVAVDRYRSAVVVEDRRAEVVA